jgi:hypothetical protein
VSDDRGIIDEMLRQAVQLLQRQDLVLVASVLETNANLGDGAALFGSGNSVTITGPTVAKLGEAASKLTTQTSALSNKACCHPAVLTSSADDALEWAEVLVKTNGALLIKLVINPYLAASSAYLMADPQTNATLLHYRLRSSTGPTLNAGQSTVPGPDGGKITYNGLVIVARYLTAVHAVSWLGIVKLSV